MRDSGMRIRYIQTDHADKAENCWAYNFVEKYFAFKPGTHMKQLLWYENLELQLVRSLRIHR